jgi:hypothetical protein
MEKNGFLRRIHLLDEWEKLNKPKIILKDSPDGLIRLIHPVDTNGKIRESTLVYCLPAVGIKDWFDSHCTRIRKIVN